MSGAPTPDYVPKVHPLTRMAAEDDPLELMAETVPGSPLVMLECILQEFAWMGFSPAELKALFHHPGYPVLQELCAHFGADAVEAKIHEMAARGGILHVRETIVEPEEDSPLELVQLRGPALDIASLQERNS